MSSVDFTQPIVGKIGDFYAWLADRLSDDAARSEVLIDLGLPPALAVGQPLPQHQIKGINEYRKGGQGAVRFRRGVTLKPDNTREPLPAMSQILHPDAGPLDIFEEEIPREGARVTRSYQYARWIGGVPLLWIGRRKSIGRGEGSSGLRFDLAE
jgi:hypothetical protein